MPTIYGNAATGGADGGHTPDLPLLTPKMRRALTAHTKPAGTALTWDRQRGMERRTELAELTALLTARGKRWGDVRAWAAGDSRWMPADYPVSGKNPVIIRAYLTEVPEGETTP